LQPGSSIANKNRFIHFDVYESNIDPYIRFMHIKNLVACGWISIPKNKLKPAKEPTTCTLSYAVSWIDIEPFTYNKIAPFKICSFDLECKSCDGSFPQSSRMSDSIIQIGMTFSKYGSNNIYKRVMISLKQCDPINDVVVISCETEQELLMEFKNIVESEDPDIMTGYNIFSFDMPYLYNRAKLLRVINNFCHLSKLKKYKCELIEKKLSSSALGDNKFFCIDSLGRVNIDLMKVVQRDEKLSSYKLDSVAENFFKDKVDNITKIGDDEFKIKSKNIQILQLDNYIRFEKNGEIIMKKYKITSIDYVNNYFIIKNIDPDILIGSIVWGMVKDDIHPSEIFKLCDGSSTDRKRIAVYCIQDCALVSKLLFKLEIITNNVNMANVCHVPLHYIFFRGQGIKSLSLVAKYCKIYNYLVPTLKVKESSDNDGYEGATVLDPDIGFYQVALFVLDFNSLYPSSMIAENISHETIVTNPEYYNLPNYRYNVVEYTKSDGSITKCTFAKKINEFIDTNPAKSSFGIIPTILRGLLDERKSTKRAMETETDSFKQKILNGKQLALKITANSLYGQLGATTSPIYYKELAACTTAVGRRMLNIGKVFVETKLNTILMSLYNALRTNNSVKYEHLLSTYLNDRDEKFELLLKPFLLDFFNKYNISPHVIYGDTDSIFINPKVTDKKTGDEVRGKHLVAYAITLGKITSKFLKTLLKYPHNMEYEKTFYPFALIAKKKYMGNKYENDIDHFKLNSMGVVLKRRDNANIVKKIVGGIVNIMMNEIDVDKTITFIKHAISDLLSGKFEIHDFITSKTLKGTYKDRTRMAHVVLADRMTERDPGNAPQLNDRIPFVSVVVNEKKGQKLLQGEKIEHPDFIKQHNLQIDYLFYLTNQIMNPSKQFLELIMKHNEVDKLFSEFIISEQDKRKGKQSLTKLGFKIDSGPYNIACDFDDLICESAKPVNNVKSKKNPNKPISTTKNKSNKTYDIHLNIEEINPNNDFDVS